MKLDLNCGACMVNQAIVAMETNNIDYQQQIKILRFVIEDIAKYLDQPTPSHFQTILLHKLLKYMQLPDIYSNEKEKQN